MKKDDFVMRCYQNEPINEIQFVDCSNRKFVDVHIRQLEQYVIQLYKIVKKDETADNIPWATGVLIEYRKDKYLLTAGHVFDDVEPGQIAFCDKQYVYPLQGEMKYTPMKHKENKVGDFAFIRLSSVSIEDIQSLNYKFLSEQQIYAFSPSFAKPVYMMYGYPVSKCKKNWQTKKILINPLFFVTEAKNDSLRRMVNYKPTRI